ncbi:hypothetical protein AAY473_027078 [Plecturocebus cupreus]
MELKEEFQEAKAWVEESFHLNVVSQRPSGVGARRGPTASFPPSSLRPRDVEGLTQGCTAQQPQSQGCPALCAESLP